MSNITMPDFKQWAKTIHTIHRQELIEEVLKLVFNQGRALGNREAICTTQEWWQDVDNDVTYQEHVLLHAGLDATMDLTKPEDE